jgi:hypothetical protein
LLRRKRLRECFHRGLCCGQIVAELALQVAARRFRRDYRCILDCSDTLLGANRWQCTAENLDPYLLNRLPFLLLRLAGLWLARVDDPESSIRLRCQSRKCFAE